MRENIIDVVMNDEFADDQTIETFECLKIYFRFLTSEQIADLNIPDIDFINIVEPIHKIIMLVFVKKYLKPYIEKIIFSKTKNIACI